MLIPLAGKSVDIAYLAARGPSVVAVDLVEDAARAFFDEQGVPAARTVDGPGAIYESGPIEYRVGDFFELDVADVGSFDSFYDRAAMVALPPDLRAKYVLHVRTMLEPGARGLVITFEHDAGDQSPPFPVLEADVRAAYPDAAVSFLAERDLTSEATGLLARGATRVLERAYAVRLPS